jgi:hypothetical protein
MQDDGQQRAPGDKAHRTTAPAKVAAERIEGWAASWWFGFCMSHLLE